MRSIIDTEEERSARIDKIFADRVGYRSFSLERVIREVLVEAQNDAGHRALSKLEESIARSRESPITSAEVEAAQR